MTSMEPDLRLVKPYPTPPTSTQSRIANGPRPDVLTFKSTRVQQMWLACACITVLIAVTKSIIASIKSRIWIGPLVAGLAGYVLADLASGVYHWVVDNYGSATTPIFGNQIDAFRRHHKWPSLITKYQVANTLHALSQYITFLFLPINLALNDPTLMAFVGSFSGWGLFSLQIHAWSHSTRSKLPPIVAALQDLGVILSHSKHAAHHLPPHNCKYCTVSGICNKVLDKYKVFKVFEKMIFFTLGVAPRCWNDPSLEWIEEKSTPSSE